MDTTWRGTGHKEMGSNRGLGVSQFHLLYILLGKAVAAHLNRAGSDKQNLDPGALEGLGS